MRVRVTSPIKLGGKIHPEGAIIDMPDKFLRPGLHVELVVEAPPSKPPEESKGGKPDDDKGKGKK